MKEQNNMSQPALLTIRYTNEDGITWLDIIFALFFVCWGLEIAFLLFGGGFIWTKPALVPGLLMVAYGSFQLARSARKIFIGRTSKRACEISTRGVTWYGHLWLKGGQWGPLLHYSWDDVNHVLHNSHSLTISQKFSWNMLKNYLRHQPTFSSNVLIYNEIDQSGGDIMKAIRQAAPQIEILSHAQFRKNIKESRTH